MVCTLGADDYVVMISASCLCALQRRIMYLLMNWTELTFVLILKSVLYCGFDLNLVPQLAGKVIQLGIVIKLSRFLPCAAACYFT